MHNTAIVMHRSAQRDTFAMLTHRRGGREGGAAFIDNRTDSWGAFVTKELGLLAGKTRYLTAFGSFWNVDRIRFLFLSVTNFIARLDSWAPVGCNCHQGARIAGGDTSVVCSRTLNCKWLSSPLNFPEG